MGNTKEKNNKSCYNFYEYNMDNNWKYNYFLRHVHHRFVNIIKINKKDNI